MGAVLSIRRRVPVGLATFVAALLGMTLMAAPSRAADKYLSRDLTKGMRMNVKRLLQGIAAVLTVIGATLGLGITSAGATTTVTSARQVAFQVQAATQGQAATNSRRCTGYKWARFASGDGLTYTYRLYPVMVGGFPPRSSVLASVWYNHTHSPYNYENKGTYVDLPGVWPSWNITGLVLKVTGAEMTYNGGIYICAFVYPG